MTALYNLTESAKELVLSQNDLTGKYLKKIPTCFPLWIRLRLNTGVLPVVIQTPAKVLLYTSFSSISPLPFSCYDSQ